MHINLFSAIVDFASNLGITFRPLEGVQTKKGHQAWTNMDGAQARLLLSMLCKEQDTIHKLLSTRNPARDTPQSTREKMQRERFIEMFHIVCNSLHFIQAFLKESVDRTRDEVEVFIQKAQALHSSLVDLDRKNGTKWYLHILLFHIPNQLLQERNLAQYTCSAQERVNSQHYHQVQTSVLLDATSEQLLKRKRLQVTFDCNMPDAKKRKKCYKPNRKGRGATKKRSGSASLKREVCTVSREKAPKKRELPSCLW